MSTFLRHLLPSDDDDLSNANWQELDIPSAVDPARPPKRVHFCQRDGRAAIISELAHGGWLWDVGLLKGPFTDADHWPGLHAQAEDAEATLDEAKHRAEAAFELLALRDREESEGGR